MQEKDIRGLLWLAAMFAGLVLMIPFVWLFHSLLEFRASSARSRAWE